MAYRDLSKIPPFSLRQLKVLTFWHDSSPWKDVDGIICDGAIRSGKTHASRLSFVEWAFYVARKSPHIENADNFLMVGRTVRAVRRNVIKPLKKTLYEYGYKVKENMSDNLMVVTDQDGFQIFFEYAGANDTKAVEKIQGGTYHGIFIDEAGLIDIGFINEAIGRTVSFEDAKFFFTTNPEGGKSHPFYKTFLATIKDSNIMYLSFTIYDNPILTEKAIEKIRRRFSSGVFYLRKILGKWVRAEGAIYSSFDRSKHVAPIDKDRRYHTVCIGVDTGASDAQVYVASGFATTFRYVDVIDMYYHKNTAPETSVEKTVDEYADDFFEFALKIKKQTKAGKIYVFVDSADKAFRIYIEKIAKKKNYKWLRIQPTNKEMIIDRISLTTVLLSSERLKSNPTNEKLHEAWENAIWNPKKDNERLDDGSSDIDSLDAFEYSIEQYMAKLLDVRRFKI